MSEVKAAVPLITSLIQQMGMHLIHKFAYLNHLATNELNLAKCLIQGIKVTKYLDFCLTDDKTWDFSSSKGDNKVRAVSDNAVRVSTPACLIKWWTTYGSFWV